MRMLARPKPVLVVVILAFAILPVTAQVATVDATDPTDPEISFDEDPSLYAPDVPEYPTVIYVDGAATATASTLTDDYADDAPTVKTAEPDTHTLSRASVYYTAPSEPAGPLNHLTPPLKFDFGSATSPVATGYIQVTDKTAYGPTTGYGWGDPSRVSFRDRGGDADPLTRDFCLPASGNATTASPTPFYVDLPNGNYKVTIVSGDFTQRSRMGNVRAEGLLELLGMGAAAGNYDIQSFPVRVKDGRLMLEFFGSVCMVNAVGIERIPDERDKRTIFVASDSTASSYAHGLYPMTGWGARLENYFDEEEILVDNQAKAGRSSKSFYEEGSLATIEDRIQEGDFLFVMFAINDSADDNSNRKTRPESTFKAYLRLYVDVAREHGATPVFVTSQTKRTFDTWGRFTNSVGAYPQAMRELGDELNVPVIDLNQKSIDFLTAIGPEASRDVYMFLDAGQYPGWPNGASDYIHLQDIGATAFAGLIAQGVRELEIEPLAKHLLDEPRPRTESTERSPY